MLTTAETIQFYRRANVSSPTLAYHSLQRAVERVKATDSSILATVDHFVIGDPAVESGALSAALDDAARSYNIHSFFHISEPIARALSHRKFRVHQLGIETIIPLPFSLDGGNKADIRRARNRALRADVRVVESNAAEFARRTESIERLNRKWLSARPVFRREFRFLARPFADEFQAGERRFIALQGERIVGLAVYDPLHSSGAVDGYFESIVRSYYPEIPGVRDLLTLSAMEIFTAEGASRLSLGLSPFVQSRPASQRRCSLTDAALALLMRRGNRLFNFRGLAFHKRRYRGLEAPIYFATKDQLPLLSLYRFCRLSNIDPLQPLISHLERLPNGAISSLRQLLHTGNPAAHTAPESGH